MCGGLSNVYAGCRPVLPRFVLRSSGVFSSGSLRNVDYFAAGMQFHILSSWRLGVVLRRWSLGDPSTGVFRVSGNNLFSRAGGLSRRVPAAGFVKNGGRSVIPVWFGALRIITEFTERNNVNSHSPRGNLSEAPPKHPEITFA